MNLIYEYGFATETGFARNVYLPLNDIVARAGSKADQYATIFGYTDPGDISNCPIYGPLYFDLDNEAEIAKAYTDTKVLLDTLKFYGLTDDDYQLAFSGCKGFHLIISPATLGIAPMVNLDKVYKRIAGWLNPQLPNKSIDFTVYERKRLWRLYGTKNSKSGLFKIPVTGQETIAQIQEMAKTPQAKPAKTPKLNNVFADWVSRALDEMEEEEKARLARPQQTVVANKNIGDWVLDQINEGAEKGYRNHRGFFIACYLSKKGFSESEIEQIIGDYAKNCTPVWGSEPGEAIQIQKTIKSALKR